MQKIIFFAFLMATAAFAQQPKFELADVHISKTAYWFAQQNAGGAAVHDGLYIYRDATMLGLIQAAYGVTEDAVGGGPSWLKSDLFDVVAKLPEGATSANTKLMLQALLAERFKLVIHNETHPMPRYVLTVAKGGAKLKRAAPSDDSGCRQQLAGLPGGRGGDGGPASLPNLKVTCHNLSSEQIAENLHDMAGGYTTYLTHDVVDATNLEGRWDFDLEFTPPTVLPDKGRDGISIFDAVNKQLSLKLELQDVPVPALVVASVNRKPTPNSPEAATALALAAPRFEVAAIKPADPDQRVLRGMLYAGGSQMRIGGTLRSLIALVFQIQPNAANEEIVGLPKSADSQIWEITAKLPSTGEGAPNSAGGRSLPPPLSVGLEMLRGLLIDQFELKTHSENREVTVYAVTLGSGKLKLTKADESERTGCIPDPNAPKPFPNLWVMANCKNFTMAEFARNLEQVTGFFDHPIVDATGLQGGWNYLIGFDHHPPPQAPNPNQPPGTIAGASDPGYMSPYEAVEKELGLKLVKTKRSIPVIIVDHVDEKPLE
jgi:uncharacterized protein (TIGR03435 family)